MSTPDTFRDALADAIWRDLDVKPNAHHTAADAVLASDEMQAIHPVLRWVGEYAMRFDWHLPEHVIRWVLDDPSPDSPADKPDTRPHSRACGFRKHEHGPDCHPNCPSCRGGEK